jgi:gliding motility-associated-like protein
MKEKNNPGEICIQSVLFKRVLLTCFAMLTMLSTYATTYTSVGGNWTVPGSWSPNAPVGGPVNGDSVVISTGTITVNIGTAVCSKVTLSGGTLTLQNGVGGLTVNGPWLYNSGTFNPNDRTITFGTKGSIGGLLPTTFRNLTISTASPTDTVKMLISGTHITNNSGGGILTLNQGIFSIGTGNTLFMDGGGGGNTINNPNATPKSNLSTTGTNGANGGTISFTAGNPVTINGPGLTTIFNMNSSSGTPLTIANAGTVLINGTITIATNSNGLNIAGANSPLYSSISTLYIDYNGQGYTPGKEWLPLTAASSTIGTTAGYPSNVTITNIGGSSGGLGNNNGWTPSANTWDIYGTLTIGSGTGSAKVDFSNVTNFNCGGFALAANGKFVAPTGNMTVKGNWIDNQAVSGIATGFFINGTSTVNFAGTGTCTAANIIQAPAGGTETFYNLGIINGTYTKLNSPVIVTNNFTLTSGQLGTSATNVLDVTNTSTTAIPAVPGGLTNTYVDGPLKWALQVTALSYVFPVGSTSATCVNDYLPFSLNKPALSVTATVQAHTPGSGGTVDATMSSLSTTEYWSMNTSVNLPASSTVSISRQFAIAPFAYVAESKTSATGTYTSLAGTASADGVSNSNDIGAGGTFFFTFGSPPIVSTLAVTSITTTSVTLNGAFNTGSSKTTSFNYGPTVAYGTTVNSIHSPINSVTAKLDSAHITGLISNTVYHYLATDGTDNGSDVAFVTAPNPPVVGTPNTPTAGGFTATWTAPASMGAAPYTYTVEVSTDPTFATNVTTQAGISSGSTSYTFTTLSSATQYYYRVEAVNATASSTWSAASTAISTLIVASSAGCVSGTGSPADPGAIAKTLVLPVIDGTADPIWSGIPANVLSNVSVGAGPNTGSTWKAMWTVDTLYFLIQVQDATVISQNTTLPNTVAFPGAAGVGTSTNYYDFDGVEITLDPDYSHGTSYDGLNDVQFRFNPGALKASGQSCGCPTQFSGTMFNNVVNNIDFKIVKTGSGYNVEAAIPWGHNAANPGIDLTASPSTYGTVSANQFIGLEVQINDANSTPGRNAQYSWYNSSSAPYQDPSQFAKAQLFACSTPPTVVSPTVTNITDTSAVLGATVTSQGDSPLTARGTGITASPNTTGTSNALPEGGTGISIYSGPAHTTLAPQTKYYYLGYANNTNGGTGVSPVANFYTLSALPKVQPALTANACSGSGVVLNWTTIAFPSTLQATNSGYLVLRANFPNTPSTAGIRTRVVVQQSTLTDINTTLVTTIPSGGTLTYTDAAATGAAGTVYNYLLVPFTWDGVTADSTYNYFTANPARVSATIGSIGAPAASATQQPSCAIATGTITINPLDPTLTYSVDGTNFAAGPTFSGLAANTYNVIAKNGGGCTSGATPVTINAGPAIPAVPTASPVQPTCAVSTGSIAITPVVGITYSIDGTNYFASTDSTFIGLNPGTYHLKAKNGNGCTSTVDVTIADVPVCGTLFIPNLITPNNDGKNDLFAITALPPGSKLNIFNRWGDKIYQSSDYDNLWTASNISDGVYFYDLVLPDGKQYKGWLDIMK